MPVALKTGMRQGERGPKVGPFEGLLHRILERKCGSSMPVSLGVQRPQIFLRRECKAVEDLDAGEWVFLEKSRVPFLGGPLR